MTRKTTRHHHRRVQRSSLIEQMEKQLPLANDVAHNFLLPGDATFETLSNSASEVSSSSLSDETTDHEVSNAASDGDAEDPVGSDGGSDTGNAEDWGGPSDGISEGGIRLSYSH